MSDASAASGSGVPEAAPVRTAADATAGGADTVAASGAGSTDAGAGAAAGAGSGADTGAPTTSPLVRADLPLTIEAAPDSGLAAITYSQFKVRGASVCAVAGFRAPVARAVPNSGSLRP